MMRFTAAELFTSLLWLSHINALAVTGEISDANPREFRDGLRDVRVDAEQCSLTHITEKIDRLHNTWLKSEENMIVIIGMIAAFVGMCKLNLAATSTTA